MMPQSGFQHLRFEEIIAFVREIFRLSEATHVKTYSLEGRGSDRTFYRLKWNQEGSAILIHYDPKRVENTFYADIAAFLREINIPVPEIFTHDTDRCLIVMEDLGDTDLWSFKKALWETRRTLYQKTLAIIHKLHCFPEENFPVARVSLMERFGPDLYRWERDYFRDHFVRNVCRVWLAPFFEQELEAELSGLAKRLTRTKPCLIHRDFQSQNVMIRDGGPFLIDFQGMRWGSFFYDLGSLLCDPYVEFNEDQRMALLLYYYNLSKHEWGWNDFQQLFWEASAQRLMQALGAYGFLSLSKGLKAFLNHIPRGLHHLQLAASRTASLPCLQQLALRCQRSIEGKGIDS